MPRPRKPASRFRYFISSPEVIGLAVRIHAGFPLLLRIVEELQFERGIQICHETVRLCWNRFGPMFAADSRGQAEQPGGELPPAFRQQGRAMLRFRQMKSLLPSMPRSTITSARNRAAALAEWQKLMA